MLAGVAGGIGAIFKAPLGGALFAAEVLYRDPDFEHDAVIPGVISSVTAYSVFTAVYGHDRILDLGSTQSALTFPSAGGNAVPELIHYGVLSLICAFVAWLLIRTRSLGACIVAHAVTNLLLGIYVLVYRDWGLW